MLVCKYGNCQYFVCSLNKNIYIYARIINCTKFIRYSNLHQMFVREKTSYLKRMNRKNGFILLKTFLEICK